MSKKVLSSHPKKLLQYTFGGFESPFFGEMLEWLKRHAWKACKPPKGFTGSNPVLSARKTSLFGRSFFVIYQSAILPIAPRSREAVVTPRA